MEGKKISFGFMKTKKVEKPVVEEKKDFIECLEEKAIKVVGGEQEEQNEPLVIPMKPNTLITAERLKEIAEKVESGLDEVLPMPSKENNVQIKEEPTDNLTLDELAVRELMQEAKKEVKVEQQELTVPIPAKPVIDGEKESTLQDYESVPIQDFGMAMLRGMGWTASKEQLAKYKPPTLRPKGLGLGADKVISDKQKKKTVNKDGKEEELAIVKNSYVKIIAGKHTGYYGKVVSLDEENGRVMVDITMKKETVSLSEFMMQPVTKAEFDKESKVINSGAYEEYKKNEKKSSQNDSPKVSEHLRHDSPKTNSREASSSQRPNDVSRERRQEKEIRDEKRRDYDNGRDKNRQERSRRNSSSDEGYNRRKGYSSSEERDSRREKQKSRRDSSSSEDRDSRRRKDKSKKRYSSEERDNRRHKEKSRRDSSGDDRDNRRRKEKQRKDSSSSDEDRNYSKNKNITPLNFCMRLSEPDINAGQLQGGFVH
ncbi:g-patch domain-containing protein [Phthorimaea operculella]|nr:g-patch domain-containing protein [Phthorimaea operculella]